MQQCFHPYVLSDLPEKGAIPNGYYIIDYSRSKPCFDNKGYVNVITGVDHTADAVQHYS